MDEIKSALLKTLEEQPYLLPEAHKAFLEKEIPNRKVEDWKYTPIKNYLPHNFCFSKKRTLEGKKEILERLENPLNYIFILNGHLLLEESQVEDSLISKRPKASSLYHSSEHSCHIFEDLLWAGTENILEMRLKKNEKLSSPLHLIYLKECYHIIMKNKTIF